MIEALRFQQTSPKLVAPPISTGLPKGLIVQLWIRRTGDTTRQPIVELAGASSRVVLGSGARPDVLSLALIANGQTTEITAPGALPIARWVQVRATVLPDGKATLDVLGMKLAEGMLGVLGTEARTLMIGASIGELAQLQVWKHSSPTKLSYTPPDLTAGNLWAYYPLAKLGWDATTQRSMAEDAGPNKRHAIVQGTTNLPIRITHDEPLDRGQAAHLRFVSNVHTPRLDPLIGLSGRLTLEAWVCPVGDSPMPVIQLQGADGRLALAAGGREGEVSLLSMDNSANAIVLARATGLAQPNQWSHVAVTLEVVKSQSFAMGMTLSDLKVGLFQQGQLRRSETFGLLMNEPASRVAVLVKSALIPEVSLGGLTPNYPRFRGGLAEVRIWRGADQERVERLWLGRARGDEEELVSCYRLDTDPSQPLVDISTRRGWAKAPSGISLQREQCPPLAATSGELAFRVQARGKLLREQLTKPTSGVATTKINLQVTNTTTGQTTDLNRSSGARCVFDATIDVSTRDGNPPLDRVLDVRLDQPLTLLQVVDGKVVQTPWASNQTHTITLPASGRVRLRFAAGQLTCPTIRLRISGTPGGVWTIVRPDEDVQGRLRGVTTQTLKSPSDGRRSPLPAGASDDDVNALTDALKRLGTQLVSRPSASSRLTASTKWLGPVGDWVDDTIDAGGDLVDDVVDIGQAAVSGGQDLIEGATIVAKSAGQLIVRGTEELEALASKCAKVSVRVGEQALANAIKSADQLAFVSAQSWSSTARWVEAIGTTIVDGSEVAWRVVVSGVEAALTAITELIERIGAQIMEWIEYLAWLFMWDDFLEASDEMHGHIETAMRGVGQQIAGLDGIKTQLGDALREAVEDTIGKRSLADVFGIDTDAVSPAFEQLDYVLEYVQELLESTDLDWTVSSLAEDTGLGPSEVATVQASEIERLQPFGDPSDVVGFLNTPLSELLASNQSLADGSSSILDAVFAPIADTSAELLEQIDGAMFSRLSVPYLSDFIEEVILCGRKLSMARIVALVAAIPAVLTEKSSSARSTRSNIEVTSTSTTDELSQAELDRLEAERRTRWVLWAVMACGIINTAVLIAKSVAERRAKNPTRFISMCQLTSGSFGILRGIFLAGRVPAFTPSTQRYAGINATVELAAGLCSVFFGVQGLEKVGKTQTAADWTNVETAIQLIFGAIVITSSGIAVGTGQLGDERTKTAFGLRCSSWVLSLLVRAFEKLDDKDKSGRLKFVTMGLAGVQVVAEVTEAIYGNVGEAQSQ